MSEAIGQHKKLAMGKPTSNYAKGGRIPSPRGTSSKPPVNFGPPQNETLPPKSGFNESPITKVKRANGIKGV
jgi:hypothetical protein